MRITHLPLTAALLALLAVLTTAGCSSTKLPEPDATPAVTTAAPGTPQAPQPAPPARPTPSAPPAQAAQTTAGSVTVHPLDDPRSALAKRSVYFDFDSSLPHDADRPVIEAHANYLATSRTAKVRIEGNCDERGGREYNVALGQRRAEAVLKSLQLMGARSAEMEATSYGKEKPVDPGHDEAAWAKNRRADLNYLAR
jgi:peptidoglycan-associated lipoprotein